MWYEIAFDRRGDTVSTSEELCGASLEKGSDGVECGPSFVTPMKHSAHTACGVWSETTIGACPSYMHREVDRGFLNYNMRETTLTLDGPAAECWFMQCTSRILGSKLHWTDNLVQNRSR